MTPLHEHDCDACIYLGSYNGHDLYCCDRKALPPTVIARFGPGPNYLSGMSFALLRTSFAAAGASPPDGSALQAVRVAYLIARDRGLLPSG